MIRLSQRVKGKVLLSVGLISVPTLLQLNAAQKKIEEIQGKLCNETGSYTTSEQIKTNAPGKTVSVDDGESIRKRRELDRGKLIPSKSVQLEEAPLIASAIAPLVTAVVVTTVVVTAVVITTVVVTAIVVTAVVVTTVVTTVVVTTVVIVAVVVIAANSKLDKRRDRQGTNEVKVKGNKRT